MFKMKHGAHEIPKADDRSIRATVNACIDPSRGTIVGMAYEAVYDLAKQLDYWRPDCDRIGCDRRAVRRFGDFPYCEEHAHEEHMMSILNDGNR